jgi:hypothetical protein
MGRDDKVEGNEVLQQANRSSEVTMSFSQTYRLMEQKPMGHCADQWAMSLPFNPLPL